MNPRVSVVIPTRDRVALLAEAIDSVLAQTYRDLEVIVVDDSTDGTGDLLRKYGGAVIRVPAKGVDRSVARNLGVEQARGEIIAFLDDDDLWLPEKLERQVRFLDAHPSVDLVHAYTSVVDARGRPHDHETASRLELHQRGTQMGYSYAQMARRCVMFTSTVAIRRAAFMRIGGYDEATGGGEDWDLPLRLAWAGGKIADIPEVLAKYRLSQSWSNIAEWRSRGIVLCAQKHLRMLAAEPRTRQTERLMAIFHERIADASAVMGDHAAYRDGLLQALRLQPSFALSPRRLARLARAVVRAR